MIGIFSLINFSICLCSKKNEITQYKKNNVFRVTESKAVYITENSL